MPLWRFCSSKAAKTTQQYAERFRVKEEIKALYIKKSLLNIRLFKLHLQILNNIHPVIIDEVLEAAHRYISIIVRRTHFNQLRKLRRLEHKHWQSTIVSKHTFYPRVMNLTTLSFDDNEMKLLNKELNYNLPPVGKNKLIYEVIEAEAAVKLFQTRICTMKHVFL